MLQQREREQIAHDISPLMSKLQNHRSKFDLGMKEKEPCLPMPVSMHFLHQRGLFLYQGTKTQIMPRLILLT